MYINTALIRAKLDDSFNFLSQKFDPELLYQAIVDICTLASKQVQICYNLPLLGGEGVTLESMPVEGLPLGSTIIVTHHSAVLVFTLSDQNASQSLAPYLVVSQHSSIEFPRAWIRSGVMYHEFEYADLNESDQLIYEHNLGFALCGVFVFDSSNSLVASVTYQMDQVNPNTHLQVNIPSGFEGTWKMILFY